MSSYGMPADAMHRLLAPRSIALIGGVWADAVAAASRAIGYDGQIWRVHPTRPSTADTPYFRSVAELPGVPDAAFVAAPSRDVPGIAASLAQRGAGGFVCFAAGFSELATAEGESLTAELSSAAAGLPYFGPNCYGFINFFAGAALWPDQVVGQRRERGVALICQSGTIALNLLFNRRSLPIGYVITVGNQTCLAAEDLIELLAQDPRVSAFGLYVEGIKDVPRFVRATEAARAANKPIALVKAGRTEAAARTARSHTGALAGADVAFDAFCRQAGIARSDTLATLCETLKVLHAGGALAGRKTLVMGASGGDMAMTADVARSLDLDFAPMQGPAAAVLRDLLTDRVTVANPFDIHTYLWFDPPALGRVFRTVLEAGYDSVSFMLDSPPEDRADTSSYHAVIEEFIAAARAAGAATRASLIASLPETLSAGIRKLCHAGGVVPLQGQREALEALALAAGIGTAWAAGSRVALSLPLTAAAGAYTLTEAEGKQALSAAGVPIPRGRIARPTEVAGAAAEIGFPVVIKAVGAALEHKTEVGGVALNIRNAAEADAAGQRLATLSDTLLVEEMTTDGVAEILVGVVVDAQFGQVLVLGAGGVLTELLADSVSLFPPWTRAAVSAGLARLTAAKLLAGYRGKPPGDVAALTDAILGVARYAAAHADSLLEIDVNPVIVRPTGLGVVAVDALVRLQKVT